MHGFNLIFGNTRVTGSHHFCNSSWDKAAGDEGDVADANAVAAEFDVAVGGLANAGACITHIAHAIPIHSARENKMFCCEPAHRINCSFKK
jgi:hypothetical protein